MRRHLLDHRLAIIAALATLLFAGQAAATPVVLSLNTNSVTVDTPYSWLGGKTVVQGQEGEFIDGKYVGGGAAVTSAAGESGLFNSFSAVAYANFNWTTSFSVNAEHPVALYMDWDMVMFSAASNFALLGSYAVNETKATFGAYHLVGSSMVPIETPIHVRYNDTASAGDLAFLGLVMPDDAFYLIVDFDVGSAVQTISAGSAMATDVGMFDFTLTSVELPVPSSLLLLGAGLVAFGLAHVVAGHRRNL